MDQPGRKLDGVFEGGGVKGIGLIGALSVIERAGYEFVNVAGTSAGAIVATLLGAGYHADELKRILMELDFKQFEDASWAGRIPLAGPLIDEVVKKGLYKGDYFLNLMRDLLAAKRVHTFRDLVLPEYADDDRYRFKVRVVASDISQGRLLVLPQDVAGYGIAPEDLEVALAVRMSMSIPFFFEPVMLQNSYIVDGGLLSNFPVEVFDSGGTPDWPTFGLKLVRSDATPPAQQATSVQAVKHLINGPVSELAAMFFTAMEAHDAYYLRADKFVRTITVDTLDIASTDFALGPDKKEALYASGVAGAQAFLATWDFDEYKALYRSGLPAATRRERVLPPVAPVAAESSGAASPAG